MVVAFCIVVVNVLVVVRRCHVNGGESCSSLIVIVVVIVGRIFMGFSISTLAPAALAL